MSEQLNRPERVKIGPLWFDVVWDTAAAADIGKRWGGLNAHHQTLFVQDDLTAERTASVFMHEVLHALFCSIQPQREQHGEEEAVYYGSYAVVQFWQDNPEAFEWWCGLVKGDQ